MSRRVDPYEVKRAAALMSTADTIAMACHIGPDGDALGSMLAVARAAVIAGKKVLPSFGLPFTVPPAYRFLPVDLLVPPDLVPAAPQVMLTFDSPNLGRLGDLAAPATAAEHLVVLDHHVIGSDRFGDVRLIDPEAAATAEIAYGLIEAVGWQFDPQVATCLLTGLVTDTGRFQYSNTSPETMRLAGALVEMGARPEEIGQHVYEETPFGYLQAAGRVLERACLDTDRGLVWSVLHQSDLDAAGIGLADTDPLIDLIRLPQEAGAALLLKQHGPNLYKGSLRSRGGIDVGRIAAELGGGGHHNAAGFTFAGPPEEAVVAVQQLLDR